MSAVTPHDDAPDHDEDADSQQQMNPPWAVERECANRPDDDHRDANENTEIHSLLVN